MQSNSLQALALTLLVGAASGYTVLAAQVPVIRGWEQPIFVAATLLTFLAGWYGICLWRNNEGVIVLVTAAAVICFAFLFLLWRSPAHIGKAPAARGRSATGPTNSR